MPMENMTEFEWELVSALNSIAYQLGRLGNADASTPMGGFEALGKVLLEGQRDVAQALYGIAGALRSRE